MANESLVHAAAVAGPATHVIVIGVGAYDHLAGGGGPESAHGEGMGQLSSAPASAVAFADWVVRSFKDAKQLASVRMLASGLPGGRYTNPRTNAQYAVQPATLANVKQAVREWKAAGDTSTENLLLFYFVGHGIAQGAHQSLLLQDFGASDDAPLESAIDFMKMHVGMQRCAARRQIYFVDACRAISGKLLDGGFAGDVIIQPGLQGYRGVEPWLAPIYFATLLGQEAYGRANSASVFTEALLRAFSGAGADNSEGTWRLRTTTLLAALDFFMKRADEVYEVLQMPTSRDATSFLFHEIEGEPRIPVLLKCAPEEAHAHVVFSISEPPAGAPSVKQGGPLDVELCAGKYQFECSFPAPPAGVAYRGKKLTHNLFPPFFSPPPLEVGP